MSQHDSDRVGGYGQQRTLRRMLEPTVHNGAQQLRLEDEILEARRVDTHVMSPVRMQT